jgi:hypothetical protein
MGKKLPHRKRALCNPTDEILPGVIVREIEEFSSNRRYTEASRADRTREGRKRLRESGTDNRQVHDSSSRPFVAWDGEGITYDQQTYLRWQSGNQRQGRPDQLVRRTGTQSYVLLGNSCGAELRRAEPGGLNTLECLEFLLENSTKGTINVCFSIGYDVEMILKDFTERDLFVLHKKGVRRWRGYRVEYRPKKWLQVSHKEDGIRRSIKIYDVWSFFGTSFVNALKEFFPDIPSEDLDKIIQGKNQRNDFADDELDEFVVPYFREELKYLVLLMERFRSLLAEVDIHPTTWHGPGALSTSLNRKHGTAEHMRRDLPPGLLDASQGAFAGGWVEQFSVGRARTQVYKYDIRSAYPTYIAQLWSMSNVRWMHKIYDPSKEFQLSKYGLYHVYMHNKNSRDESPQPLFRRSSKGYISFPRQTFGWHWGPELIAAMPILKRDNVEYYIDEAWIPEFDKAPILPFGWVREEYFKRQKMKAEGIAAQIGIKLGLNSLYGKQAQKSGWKEGQPIPMWHQYEWAGWVTAATRGMMFSVAMEAQKTGTLIGIETDAIFTTAPVPGLTVGTRLGEWDLEVYDDILYLQTGMYFLLKNGEWKAKYRGIDRETLSVDRALEWSESTNLNVVAVGILEGLHCTRFVGSKGAMHQGVLDEWRTWRTDPKILHVGASYKRIHLPPLCPTCKSGKHLMSDGLHRMVIGPPPDGKDYASYPQILPWRKISGEVEEWDDSNGGKAEESSFIPSGGV